MPKSSSRSSNTREPGHASARHLQLGSAAEKYARQWLCARGLKFLAGNFRCKAGEIDLILRDGHCLVIAEVRYRANDSHGGALASVTRRKQQRIIRATRVWLQRHPAFASLPIRFDVLALQGPANSPQVDWCRRAFDGTG